MPDRTLQELGQLVSSAVRLETKPIAVYGSDMPLGGGVPLSFGVHRCIATPLVRMHWDVPMM
jgi:hypothetical protein